MLPLPKRLRNRRNKANIKGLQRCRSMAKHQRHLLLCTLLCMPALPACYICARPDSWHGVECRVDMRFPAKPEVAAHRMPCMCEFVEDLNAR